MCAGVVPQQPPTRLTKPLRAKSAIIREVSELSGAPPDEVFRFFAHGMLLNIITALDLPALAGENPVIAAWDAEHQH